MSETLSYIAGFFDGEGSVSITRRSKRRELHNPLFLQVCVVQTQREVLEWIRAELDCGGVLTTRSRKGSLGKKTLYVLQWTGASAGQVLEKLLPYLKVKRGKAEVGLAFQATMSRSKYTNTGVPANVLDLRSQYREQIAVA